MLLYRASGSAERRAHGDTPPSSPGAVAGRAIEAPLTAGSMPGGLPLMVRPGPTRGRHHGRAHSTRTTTGLMVDHADARRKCRRVALTHSVR